MQPIPAVVPGAAGPAGGGPRLTGAKKRKSRTIGSLLHDTAVASSSVAAGKGAATAGSPDAAHDDSDDDVVPASLVRGFRSQGSCCVVTVSATPDVVAAPLGFRSCDFSST